MRIVEPSDLGMEKTSWNVYTRGKAALKFSNNRAAEDDLVDQSIHTSTVMLKFTSLRVSIKMLLGLT
ncbi:hypothetical protein VTL71DRAFT_13331 [Oculimacula yallundae]|uniref:Uncharacterized protein n=1 Tax=Oculimacula yallundae TaxID=86028 RepID=A0ABR4CK59_9HELO